MVITTTEQAESLNYVMQIYEQAIKEIMGNLRLMKNVDATKNTENRRIMLRKNNTLINFDLAPVSTKLQYLRHDISARADTLQQMKNSIDEIKLKLNTEKKLENNSNIRKLHKETVEKFNMENAVR